MYRCNCRIVGTILSKTFPKGGRFSLNKKNRVREKEKTVFIIALSVLLLIASVLVVVLMKNKPEDNEIYTFVNHAIDDTEALDKFLVQISSSAQLTVDGNVQVTKTMGYISSKDDLGDVYVYLNTTSETPKDPSGDFNVTVAMYTDGEKVYDDSTGKPVEVDMTAEEFQKIVADYKLYRYDEKDCEKAEFDENEIEEFKGGGNVTVTLTAPSDEVLSAYAEKISQVTGEKVKKNDLNIKSAYVTYSIYDDMISAQTCTFAVEYVCEDERVVQYSVTNQVVYGNDTDENEDMELIIPETQEGNDA